MNDVKLKGNLVRKPELRTIPSGQSVCNFTVAINERYQDKSGEWKDNTDFVDCVGWGNVAERLSNCNKGDPVLIRSAKIKPRSWQDQEGQWHNQVDVVVASFERLWRKPFEQAPASEESKPTDDESVGSQDVDLSNDGEDVPF